MNWQQTIDGIAEDYAASMRAFHRRLDDLAAAERTEYVPAVVVLPAVGAVAARTRAVTAGRCDRPRAGEKTAVEKTTVPLDWNPDSEEFPIPMSWLV